MKPASGIPKSQQPGPRLIVGRVPLPVTWRLAGFYGAAFLTIGVFMPFWPKWLQLRGLGPEEIGLVLALSTIAKVIGSPLFAHLSDRLGARRRVMIGLSLAALAAFVFYSGAGSLWSLALGAVLVGFTFPPLLPLGENSTLLAARISGFDYGRVRLWGSITFIVAAWGGGAWIERLGVSNIPWLVIGAASLLVVACALMPDVRVARATGGRAFRGLLSNRLFLLFMATTALIQCSHAAYYGFSTLHWSAAGISDSVIGLLWAEGVVAEIILFAFAGRIVQRIGIGPLLWLAAISGVVRWGVTGATTELAALVIVQALHAATFGATHLAAMHFIQTAVPESISATAQGLYSAIVMGLILAAVMSGSGALFAMSAGAAFYAMAAMCAAGGLCAVLLRRAWNGGELSFGTTDPVPA